MENLKTCTTCVDREACTREDKPEDRSCWMKHPGKSFRRLEWEEFAKEVAEHIESYTVPQYGDWPNDNVAGWSGQQCADCVGRYHKRFGRNARQGQDRLDMVKAAHYACLAASKIAVPEWEEYDSPYASLPRAARPNPGTIAIFAHIPRRRFVVGKSQNAGLEELGVFTNIRYARVFAERVAQNGL